MEPLSSTKSPTPRRGVSVGNLLRLKYFPSSWTIDDTSKRRPNGRFFLFPPSRRSFRTLFDIPLQATTDILDIPSNLVVGRNVRLGYFRSTSHAHRDISRHAEFGAIHILTIFVQVFGALFFSLSVGKRRCQGFCKAVDLSGRRLKGTRAGSTGTFAARCALGRFPVGH